MNTGYAFCSSCCFLMSTSPIWEIESPHFLCEQVEGSCTFFKWVNELLDSVAATSDRDRQSAVLDKLVGDVARVMECCRQLLLIAVVILVLVVLVLVLHVK